MEKAKHSSWDKVLIALICLSGFTLMGLRNPTLGWAFLVVTFALTILNTGQIRRHLSLVLISLALLGLTPINTNISYWHMLYMGAMIGLAVFLPYYFCRFIYRDHLIRFPLHHGRRWYKTEVGYILFTAVVGYFVLPYYLGSTDSYLNWTVHPGTINLVKLFIGTNALGIWDELFFVATVLAIFRRYLPFWWANLAQAILWTSFLYELGFRGWGPAPIFLFALLQGQIFRKTESLLYILTIHLTLDFILFLALIHAHYPQWIPLFIYR